MSSSDTDQSSSSDEGPELESLNISNDQYYKPVIKTGNKAIIDSRKAIDNSDIPTYGSPAIQHSLAAYDLWKDFFPTFVNDDKFLSFHRPKLRHFKNGPQALSRAKIRRGFPIYNLSHHIARHQRKLLNNIVGAIKSGMGRDAIINKYLRIYRAKDLTSKRGDLFLFEYSEEHPIVLNQNGMAANINTYIVKESEKSCSPRSQPQPHMRLKDDNVSREDGIGFETIIGDQIGTIKSANCPFETTKKVKQIYFNSLKPGARLKVIETNMTRAPIFEQEMPRTDFLIIRTRNSFYVRPITAIYTVGQIMPLVTIPCPNPPSIYKFRYEFSNRYLHKLFMESKEDPPVIDLAQLKELFPDYPSASLYSRLINKGAKRLKNSLYCRSESSLGQISLKELRQSFLPEQYCVNMSMLATRERLRDMNYTESMIIQSNCAESEAEILAAPWNVSKAVRDAQLSKCYLDFKGHLIDPTGSSREGFSCVAWSKSPTEEQQAREQKINDQNASRDSIGRTPQLKNPLAHKIRQEKLSRLATYQSEAQLIAQIQNSTLSSRQELSSDEDNYDSDENDNENSKFKTQLRDLDRLVLEGRHLNELNFEKEEEERRELMRELNINSSQSGKDRATQLSDESCKDETPSWLNGRVLKITRTYETDEGLIDRIEIVREPKTIALYVKEKGELEKWSRCPETTSNGTQEPTAGDRVNSNSQVNDLSSRRHSMSLGASRLCRADGCVVTISKSVLDLRNMRKLRRESARH